MLNQFLLMLILCGTTSVIGKSIEDLSNRNNDLSPHEVQDDKRQIHPPKAFEEIEKKFLINQSIDYLFQFVGYVEYIEHNNETRTALEDMLVHERSRLLHMSVAELKAYVASLQHTLESGVNANHEMVINGKTYSLDHISSWCCQFG